MATFRFYVPKQMTVSSPSVTCKEEAGQFYFEFHNVDELEPFPTLSPVFCEHIAGEVTEVTVLLNNEEWMTNSYQEDGARYHKDKAKCVVRSWTSYHGHADITIKEHTKVLVIGPTLESVLHLIFAMKRGDAQKVGDPTFAEYAKENGISTSAIRKSWRQQLRDWWERKKKELKRFYDKLRGPEFAA